MKEAFVAAFTEWDRRYREDPGKFMTDVEHLLGNTPATYGEACGVYFEALLQELARAQPTAVASTGSV